MRPRTAGWPGVDTISAVPPAASIRAATCSAPASMSSSEADTVGRCRKRRISSRCPSKSASIRSQAGAQGGGSNLSPALTLRTGGAVHPVSVFSGSGPRDPLPPILGFGALVAQPVLVEPGHHVFYDREVLESVRGHVLAVA